MPNFQQLDVYKVSQEYIKEIYQVTKDFPKDEKFGIIDQIRRAVISISANVAEGCGRYHSKDFTQFLRVARGSCYEVVALLDTSLNLEYLDKQAYNELNIKAERINKMLSALINSIKK